MRWLKKSQVGVFIGAMGVFDSIIWIRAKNRSWKIIRECVNENSVISKDSIAWLNEWTIILDNSCECMNVLYYSNNSPFIFSLHNQT